MTAEEHIAAAEALLEPVANPDLVNSTYLLDRAKTHLAIARLKLDLAVRTPPGPAANPRWGV